MMTMLYTDPLARGSSSAGARKTLRRLGEAKNVL